MNTKELRKEILRLIYGKGYRYIARDDDGIYAHEERPTKKIAYFCSVYWESKTGNKARLNFLDKLFKDVTVEDKEAINIADELGIIDWLTIPKDTKVLVSQDGKNWVRRHFAGFNEKGTNKFIVYGLGETSWTTNSRSDDFRVAYEYCKLAKGK